MFETLSGKKRVLAGVAVSSGLIFGATFGAQAVYAQDGDSTNAQKKVPAYQVIDSFDASGIVEVDVSTNAAKEKGLKRIADDLRDENTPKDGTLLVEYYDNDDTTENTGFALVFDNRKAVMDAGQSEQFGEVYDRDEAGRIIREEDGMRVVSYKDFAEENSTLWGKIKNFLL